MKGLKFIIAGVLFGIILSKTEVISWFRIQEMFRFQSFHMYGVIGTAVAVGVIGIQLIKRLKLKDIEGSSIVFTDKEKRYKSALIGGTIFGLGWAITGACPGPLYILVGNGLFVFIISILSAILGTFVYGKLRDKLPH